MSPPVPNAYAPSFRHSPSRLLAALAVDRLRGSRRSTAPGHRRRRLHAPPPPRREGADRERPRDPADLGAPPRVARAIAAANKIVGKPYRYGGGHRLFSSRLDSRLRLLRLGQPGAARRPLPAYAARLVSFLSWGQKGAGQLDHGLHRAVARLRRDRRPALRHQHARAERARARHRPRLEHEAARVERASSRATRAATEPAAASRRADDAPVEPPGAADRLGTRDLNPNFHIQSVACCRYTSPQRRPSSIEPLARDVSARRRRPGAPSRGTAARRRRPPRAARRGCPARRSRPRSSTTIRPASRIVESRCAITIAVRPASSRRRPCSISRLGVHVDVRGRLVEDQDARVGGRRARERHQLALAGGQVAAALADLGVVAVGQPLDELVRADGRGRRLHVRLGRAGPRRTRCCRATVPENRKPSCGTMPELRAQRALGHRRAGRARRPARARGRGRRSARRAWRASTCRRRSRRRARASGPGGTCSVDLARGAGVAGRRRRTTRRRSRSRRGSRGSSIASGCVAQVGLLVEQVEDLVERRHARLVGRVELGELLDRVEEALQVERRTRPARRS